ncbi:cell wall integrity and stress response protein 1 [Bifidobacterium pseudolongum subsp. globosum]|uniref:Cell wall integrity and stress response protein 1 n=1 Tax=Bifidobacterium pseudolongum subsp. globosum TaxID=1690 RepID=A0A4Q5AXY6_9BIFI|nr:LytR C-terminal domain-containing protein [Bifidobacterium pseudolongum]MBS6345643.1 LytR C-terminal domain-containing protein [Bifidobacterium pseudolongum]RYQ33663.1 cell wall integrity and stress response protein 1 [Bifidobacterium pseudolongum subsp. globosum]RYQ37522.1 cell wall integrity and stress response protein 1 [Bifidobacterium pseudolongum subsp. globosum]RYQ40844.1 cell wall integrity and stress response protein 1 [Bifidobacterium pseudolongum subsp. globosum]RYQ73359.1 cell w
MARKDTEQYQSYEKDAFDNPPEGPVGVHRGNRPMIVRVTPFIIVLVAAVAAGVLFWSIFSGEAANMFNRRSEQTQTTAQTSQGSSSSSADESASGTASQSSQSATAGELTSAEGTPSQTPSESESAQSTPEESQQVNTNAQITVINGTGVSGYANDRAGVLQNQGFTNVSAANPDATTVLPAQTVVYYQNEADLATAQQVANALGIAAVEQSTSIGTPIQVVLMQ